MPEFTILPFGPLPQREPLPAVPLPRSVALTFESALPGGWTAATVGIIDDEQRQGMTRRQIDQSMIPEPVDVRPKGHVEIHADGVKVWEGRVEGDELVGGERVAVRGLELDGYGIALTNQGWFRGGAVEEQVTAGQIVRDVIRDAAPLLSLGTLVDPGGMHGRGEYRMPPAQVLEALSEEGDGEHPWTWWVYDRVLDFVPKVAADPPHYSIPWDSTVRVRRNHRNIWSRVALQYRDPTQTASGGEDRIIERERSDTALAYGELSKLLTGGQQTGSGAANFVLTFLARAAAPEVFVTVQRDFRRGVEMSGGGSRAAWLVRAGESLEVRGLPALLIERVSVDARQELVTIECGMPPPTTPRGLMNRLVGSEVAIRTARDVVTRTGWGR